MHCCVWLIILTVWIGYLACFQILDIKNKQLWTFLYMSFYGHAKAKAHTVMIVQPFLKEEFSNNVMVLYVNQKISYLFS